LILDDWGPEHMTASQRRDLMEIVDDRYNRKAIIVTIQLPVDNWYDIISEPTFADAILDKLVHHAYRVALDGLFMRKTRCFGQPPTPLRPPNDRHVTLWLCPQGPPTRSPPPTM